MKRFATVCAVVVALVVCFGAANASAYQLPIVTGEHWVNSTEGERKAFLLGAATIIGLEFQVQGPQPPSEQTLVDTWVKGLSQYNLESLAKEIDDYYKNNPDKLSRPVVEVMWTEFTLPNVYK
jgi:hypothetical protein